MKFADRAAPASREILGHLGIAFAERGRHFDCPVCEAQKSARVVFDRTKIVGGAWVCKHCTSSQYKPILDLCLRASGRDFADLASELETAGIVPTSDVKPPPRVERIAFQYQPVASRESRYLASRGLRVPPGISFGYQQNKPVMVCDVRDSRAVIGRHFTFLQGGEKIDVTPRKYQKRFDDSPTMGHIELMPHKGVLGVAEGIETAIAASLLHGVPCWSCIDARQLAGFEPPDDVHEIRIFGDADYSATGQAAAWTLCRRLRCSPRGRSGELTVHWPEFPDAIGADWNDVLLQQREVA